MSDAPTSDSTPDPMPSVSGTAREVEVDVAAFLPEGVELRDAPLAEEGSDEPPAPGVDLEALSQIERDLDAVDAAIAALDAGTYGVDPTTGAPIDDDLLAEDPTRLS